ncbi:MAG: choice-of-anchor P family protein [bacterium]
MGQSVSSCWRVIAVGAVLAGVVGWPTASGAQTGQARAVQAAVLGSTTGLSDTGTLTGSDDARQASQVTGVVPSLLTAEVLHATTIGWPDQSVAEASLATLELIVAGNGISAGFVMARAFAALGDVGAGDTTIDDLSINGVPIAVTGEPNQTIPIPGGRVVINEQWHILPSGMAVNALHVVVDGVADVVIASAMAGI